MCRVFRVVVMTKEGVIESELQDNRHKRERDGQKRQHAEFARSQVTRVDGHQNKPERGIDHAADSEYERVLDSLFDLAVYRGRYSRRLIR